MNYLSICVCAVLSAIEKVRHIIPLWVFRMSLKSCGRGPSVFWPITISHPDRVEIGDDVSFGTFVHVWGSGGVTIGDRVMIGVHTSITSVTHDHSKPVMRFASLLRSPVRIEDDVWIGSNAVILPGVTLGKGCVVGAGAVVTKDVPANAIVVGVPARILRFRV
jgi:acetyltransferase-like isoleucine patch superfamily enzyme